MLRAGLIRRLAAGLYSWLPLGLRVLQKVERIIREEMNRSGALELVMPVFQPAELWQESGRWMEYGPELLRIKDRHQRDFVAGPTHEEVITDIARRELKSYRQLPVNFYQIQTKFRDEVRPRFGVMRAREFIMKDAYSFHMTEASLQEGYRDDVRRLRADLHAHRTSSSAPYAPIRVRSAEMSRRSFTSSPLPARMPLHSRTGMTTRPTWRPPSRCRRRCRGPLPSSP